MRSRFSLVLSFASAATILLTAATTMFAQCPYSIKGATNTAGAGGNLDADAASSAQVVHHTSDTNFKKDVLEAKQPVLVDFYATWCGPCQRLSPVIESVSKSYSGKVSVFKVDVDKSPKLAERYGITSIPSIKMFKKGKLVDSTVGLLSESQLKDKIEKLL